MEIALMTEPQLGGSYADLLRLAQWTESHGLDSFTRSDHYLNMTESEPVTDALTSLAGLARETTTVKLTVLVSPLTFRHPAVIAKTATTLHEMSNGRFELGIGTGWMEGEHEAFGMKLGSLGERFDRFEESLGYLAAAFGRTAPGFDGEHFSLAEIEVKPQVGTALPIVIGGGGMRRTPRLAGTCADEYNMFVTDPETLEQRRQVMRSAAAAAGRDPDAVKLSLAMSPIVGTDDADYRERLGRAAADRSITSTELASQLDERNVPHGAQDAVSERIAALAGLGVERIYLQQFAALPDIDLEQVAIAVSAIRAI